MGRASCRDWLVGNSNFVGTAWVNGRIRHSLRQSRHRAANAVSYRTGFEGRETSRSSRQPIPRFAQDSVWTLDPRTPGDCCPPAAAPGGQVWADFPGIAPLTMGLHWLSDQNSAPTPAKKYLQVHLSIRILSVFLSPKGTRAPLLTG